MRLTKGDPTGSYSYLADGVSPASSVLTDGHTTFTPGISEYNGLGSRFYVADAQGNSRGLLDGGQNATDGYNWDAFGSSVSRFGSNPTPLAWNEEAGYQSDGDSGLKLLGHRYYDSRTGRFISADPAGSGNNWYAYTHNDPMDGSDPSGLADPNPSGMWSIFGGTQSDATMSLIQAGQISPAAAFGSIGITPSLATGYTYYSVYQITYLKSNGNITKMDHLFDLAVPSGVVLLLNYRQAQQDHKYMAPLSPFRTYHYFMGSHGNGIGGGTTGDYKDKPYPKNLTAAQKIKLYNLLDNTGNFGGGMVAQGYGTWRLENPLIGAVAKSLSNMRHGGWPSLDDAPGQRAFDTGWQYGQQNDSSSNWNFP